MADEVVRLIGAGHRGEARALLIKMSASQNPTLATILDDLIAVLSGAD